MVHYKTKNNAQSMVVNDPLSAGGTTLNVTSGTGSDFPDEFPFVLTLWNASVYTDPDDDPDMEIVEATGRAADAILIGRGKEDTTGVAHAAGTRVAMLLTAGIVSRLAQGAARVATATVAASDSQHQAVADYVCEGVDDHTIINPILLEGYEVVMMGGNYVGNALLPNANVHLHGAGKVTYTGQDITSPLTITNKNDVLVEGITFDAAEFQIPAIHIGGTSTRNTLRNLGATGTGNTRGALELWSVDGNTVDGCQVYDGGLYGILVRGNVDNNHIVNNKCWGNGYAGIELYPDANGAYGNLISHNRCWNNGHGGIIANGAQPVEQNIFSLNSCWGNEDMGGIYLAYANCKYNTFIGNTCRDGVGGNAHGLHLFGACYNTIIGNTTSGAPNLSSGIFLEAQANYNTIIGNIVAANLWHGIALYNSHHNEYTKNLIVGNGINAPGSHSGIIVCDTSSYNLFEGNHYNKGDNVQQYGLYMFGGGSASHDNIVRREWFDNGGVSHDYLDYGTDNLIMQCIGWVTENSGTDTVPNSAAIKVVTHGLSETPVAGDIMITPLADIAPATHWWISAIGSSTFQINLDQTPTNAALFAWSADTAKGMD